MATTRESFSEAGDDDAMTVADVPVSSRADSSRLGTSALDVGDDDDDETRGKDEDAKEVALELGTAALEVAGQTLAVHGGVNSVVQRGLLQGLRFEFKLAFPIEVAYYLFKNLFIKFGGGDGGLQDAIIDELREATDKILEGIDALRTAKLKTARNELKRLLGLINDASFDANNMTPDEMMSTCNLAERITGLADEAFNTVARREDKVSAVKIAVIAIAARGCFGHRAKFVATQFRYQVDMLLEDGAVKSAIEIQNRGGSLTSSKKEREAFLRGVLNVVDQEIFFLREHGLRREANRPLLATDEDVGKLEVACCGASEFLRATTSEQGELGLSVAHMKFKGRDASKLTDALENIKLVRTLALAINTIGPDGASKLAAALEKNSTLTTLRLQENNIGDDGASKLAAALEKNSTVTTLRLQANKVGPDGASKLAAALETNSTLTTLSLWYNNIGDDGASKLAAALEKNSTLTTLYLWHNNIGDDGASKLAAALEKNSTLTTLGLEANNIDNLTKIRAMLRNNELRKKQTHQARP